MTGRFLDSKKFTTARKNMGLKRHVCYRCQCDLFLQVYPKCWGMSTILIHPTSPRTRQYPELKLLAGRKVKQLNWCKKIWSEDTLPTNLRITKFLSLRYAVQMGENVPHIYYEPTFFLTLLASFPVHTGDTKEVILTFVVLSQVGLSHLS